MGCSIGFCTCNITGVCSHSAQQHDEHKKLSRSFGNRFIPTWMIETFENWMDFFTPKKFGSLAARWFVQEPWPYAAYWIQAQVFLGGCFPMVAMAWSMTSLLCISWLLDWVAQLLAAVSSIAQMKEVESPSGLINIWDFIGALPWRKMSSVEVILPGSNKRWLASPKAAKFELIWASYTRWGDWQWRQFSRWFLSGSAWSWGHQGGDNIFRYNT